MDGDVRIPAIRVGGSAPRKNCATSIETRTGGAMSSRTYRGSGVVRAARGGARPYRVRVGVFVLAAVVVVVVVVVSVHGRPRGGEERERGGREKGGRCAGHPSKAFGGARARGDSGGCNEGQTFVVGVNGCRHRKTAAPRFGGTHGRFWHVPEPNRRARVGRSRVTTILHDFKQTGSIKSPAHVVLVADGVRGRALLTLTSSSWWRRRAWRALCSWA